MKIRTRRKKKKKKTEKKCEGKGEREKCVRVPVSRGFCLSVCLLCRLFFYLFRVHQYMNKKSLFQTVLFSNTAPSWNGLSFN